MIYGIKTVDTGTQQNFINSAFNAILDKYGITNNELTNFHKNNLISTTPTAKNRLSLNPEIMKIITYLFGFLFFFTQNCKGQSNIKEKDSVYYYLDTAAVPIKDRMVFKDSLEFAIAYTLPCQCNLWGGNINFEKPKSIKSKPISLAEFKKLNTVSITDLITIAVKKIKEKDKKTSYFFIEPNGKEMKISKVFLMDPKRTHEVLDKGGVYFEPDKN